MQETAERLLAHLDWTIEYARMLRDEIEPVARPRVPAYEVGYDSEIQVDGHWRSVVTRRRVGSRITFVCVGATVDADEDELLIARPRR